MKKSTRGKQSGGVRLSREAIRMLSGSDLDQVAGGCPNTSCEMGTISRISQVRGLG